MYTSVKIKSKNLYGLSAKTIVYHNDENNIVTIQSVMFVPNEHILNDSELIRQFRNYKVICNSIKFKLSTSIQVCDALSSIFISIMQRNNFTNIEFTKFANNINYETQSDK